MSEPPTYEIRARTFAEILDAAFQLVKGHFLVLVGCAALLYIPLGLAGAALLPNAETADTDEILEMLPAIGILVAAILLLSPVVTAAITHAVAEIYLGHGARFGSSMQRGIEVALPLIGTWLLASLAIAGAFLLPLAPLLVISSGPLTALLGLVAFVAGIHVAVGFLPLTQAMVIEGRFGPTALRRSYELMRGHQLRGFGVLMVSAILVGVLQSVFAIVLIAVPPLQPLGDGVGQSIGFAFMQAVTVVFYFDLRSRKESFALDDLASRGFEGRPKPFDA